MPTASTVPAALIGSWMGTEADANLGITWDTAYRIHACRQYDEPWKLPTADQECGEWAMDATVDDLPARCAGTLYWLGQDDGVEVFLAKGREGSSKYRTIPHPYLEIDGRWFCWDTFRLRLTPAGTDTVEVETVGAGAQAGAFAATTGTIERADP